MIFTKKAVAMLLISVMGLFPVGGALAMCSQMERYSMEDNISALGSMRSNAVESRQQFIKTQIHHKNKSTMNCHLNGHCVAHLCGNCGLFTDTPVFFFSHSLGSPAFILSVHIKDWIVSPESRPPIATL